MTNSGAPGANRGSALSFMDAHKTAVTGVGGLLAMLTVEQLNAVLGTVIGFLTVFHLCILIFKSLRKK